MHHEVNLLYQETNSRPFHHRPHGVQAGFTVRNPTWRNFLFFFLSQHKRHWGRVRDNTTHLSSYVKSSVSCSYKKLSLIQFNIQKIRYGEERFRSNIHVRRDLRISCNISHFNIFLSIIFQVCLLSNKESFFKDMRYFR